MNVLTRYLNCKDFAPCPFCNSKMKIIDLNDSKIKSELPKSIALKDNLNLLIFCSNHECGSHKFFSNIVINTHDELENFKIFWNSRKK